MPGHDGTGPVGAGPHWGEGLGDRRGAADRGGRLQGDADDRQPAEDYAHGGQDPHPRVQQGQRGEDAEDECGDGQAADGTILGPIVVCEIVRTDSVEGRGRHHCHS